MIREQRQVKLSIRLKIIAVTAALVLVSLGLYLVIALNLFNSDKSAYVFESSLSTADGVAAQAENLLTRVLKDTLSVYNLVVDMDLKPAVEREPLPFTALGAKKKPRWTDADARALKEAEDALALKRTPKTARAAARLLLQRAEGKADASSTAAARAALEALYPAESDQATPPPVDLEGLHLMARALLALRRFAEAEETLVKFTKIGAQDARLRRVYFEIGELRFSRRAFDAAGEAYKRALTDKDPLVSAYAAYKLGWSHARLSRMKEALEQWQRLGALTTLPPALATAITSDTAYAKAEPPATKVKRDADAASPAESRRLLRGLFYGDPDLVELSVYAKPGKGSGAPARLLRLVNNDYLSASDLKPDYLDRVDRERPLPFDRVSTKRPLLQNSSLKNGMALLTLTRQDPLTGRVVVARIKLDRLLDAFSRNRRYTTYLLDAAGELFVHPDTGRLATDTNLLREPQVLSVVKAKQRSGVREVKNRAGEELIVATADVGLFDLVVFTEIERAKAFLAARELTKKSAAIGVFFIALAMIIGIVFAKTLTNPIDRLFQGTKILAGGDFKAFVDVKSRDEIGVLADSFNFMAQRIVALLEQEKDKVRMEEELKVAKLVQDSFFPATRLTAGRLQVASFYTPSSECGGDWWTIVQDGPRSLLLIGDATGHGVPAALITATAAACCTTVETMARRDRSLLSSPARILEVMNRAVYVAAQGKIQMTFFACVVDPESGKVVYSNASHNAPYLYQLKDKDPDKKDLKPLIDAVGFRLGHKPDATYVDAELPLKTGDSLVLFTDGMIECENPAKEEWGTRKFIKSILRNAKAAPDIQLEGVMEDAMAFYAGQPLKDDLTMVIVKVLPEASAATAA